MATLAFSSLSVRTWNKSSATWNWTGAAVAGDGLDKLLVVGGFDQLVDELCGQGVADPEPGHGGLGAQRDQQVRLAGAAVADQAQRQALLDPLAGGQGMDDGGIDIGVGVEVEAAQGLFPGEPGGLDPPNSERRRARSSHSAISSSARKPR
jgi:hypothetical protein